MFNIPTSTFNDLTGSASQLIQDLLGPLILAIALPFAFWIARIIIKAISKRDLKEDEDGFDDYDSI
jgi:hypothetical protein